MCNLFFRNRRLLILTIGVIVVSGLASYQALPRLEDPELTNRFATIKTRFPGADAERVEALVTKKLEERIREIEEIKLVESQSRAGISVIRIELRDEVDQVDEVWSRMRDQVNDVAVELPEGVLEPDFDVLDVGAYAWILAISWTAQSEPNYAIMRRHAEDLAQLLRSVPGTEKVDLFGDPVEEILAEILPEQLATMGLSVSDVAAQLTASDAKISAGQYRSGHNTLLLEVDSHLDSLERVRRTPIRFSSGGRFVPLGNVAEIRKGIKMPTDSLAVIGGLPAVVIAARVPSSTRIDTWATAAAEAVGTFTATLPPGLQLDSVFEQSVYVSARMDDLSRNLLFGALAVLLVMFLMMGWRSALIVSLALPLASLMVLTGLRYLGIPIQQMSVTGLIIALGLLIDNAIVMVDEVRERLGEGLPRAEAVTASVRHLAVPLFGSSLTTALAFAPMALMPGPVGEFVGAIAVSVILAIFSSLLVSLTVVAALAGMGLPVARQSGASWWRAGLSHPAWRRIFARSLDASLAHPAWGIVLASILPLLGFLAVPALREQFFPPEERNQFQIELELPVQASWARTIDVIERARDVVLRHPEVISADWFQGASAPSFYYNVIPRREDTSQYAQAIVTTRERLKSKDLLRKLQAELDGAFPESRVLVRQLEQGPPFDAPVELRVTGPDPATLRELGDSLRTLLAEVPHVIHTAADLSETVPQLALAVDEESARLVGLDNAAISRQLYATLEGAVGGSILEGTEELPVRVRVSDTARADLQYITSLDLIAAGGVASAANHSPVRALAEVSLVSAPALIAHRNGSRVNTVKAYITAGVLPSEVLTDFQDRLAHSDIVLPAGYVLEYGGEAAKRNDAVGNLVASVAPLAVVMLASLVLTFNAFRMAGLISLVGILSAGLGMLMLWLFNYPFGFVAIIGTMGLVGVAINDSIVVLAALMDDTEARRGEPAAISRIVLRSTRHVLATTLTTVAGFAPLFLWGGAFWEPLAVTIAGGVAGATFLALYLVPCAFILMSRPPFRSDMQEMSGQSLG